MANPLATIDPSPANLPALAGFNLYAAVMAGRSARTATSYASDYRQWAAFLKVLSPGEALDRLISAGHSTANALALTYKADMMGRGLASATIARWLAALAPV